MKRTPFVRIAHLSDIHIGACGEGDLDQIHNWLRESSPTHIVVTGDLVDSPKKHLVADARAWLDRLSGLGVPICLCPGNHDTRYKGNKLPFFGSDKSARAQFRETFSVYYKPHLTEDKSLLLYPFDTTAGGLFAQGAHNPADIAALRQLLLSQPPMANARLKVALAHHHPLPVVDKAGPNWMDNIGGPQAYTMMRDASSFLIELMRAGFSLVLHGHEHVSGDWTISTAMPGGSKTLQVAYTGPSTLVDGHMGSVEHFARVSLYEYSAAGAWRREDYTRTQKSPIFYKCGDAIDMHGVPLHAGEVGLRCRHYSRSYVVSPEGDVLSSTALSSVTTKTEIAGYPLSIRAGSAMRRELKLVHSLSAPRKTISLQPRDVLREGGATVHKYEVLFDPRLKPDEEVSFTYDAVIQNGIKMTIEEKDCLKREADLTGMEWVGTLCPRDIQCESLAMSVRFPSRTYLDAVSGTIVVDIATAPETPPDKRNGYLTADMLDEERQRVMRDMVVHPISAEVHFYVYRPIPGLSYRLQWRPPEHARVSDLLRLTKPLRQDYLFDGLADIERVTKEVAAGITTDKSLRALFGNGVFCTVHVLDNDGMLRALGTSGGTGSASEGVEIGKGPIGRAYKIGRTCYQCLPQRAAGLDDTSWIEASAPPEAPWIVVCVPLGVSQIADERIVAVVTIGSWDTNCAAWVDSAVDSNRQPVLADVERRVWETAYHTIVSVMKRRLMPSEGVARTFEEYVTRSGLRDGILIPVRKTPPQEIATADSGKGIG